MIDPFPWAAGLEVPLVIAGNDASSGRWTDDSAPASGQVLGRIQVAEPGDVSRAVSASREAATTWAAMGPRERGSRIHRLADLLESYADELALTEARDTGSPLSAMAADVHKGIGLLHLYSGLALEMQGRTIPASDGLHFTLPQPWGVVGAITAYNHPFLFACIRSGPALIAGNAVILKPAPQTPLSALALGANRGRGLTRRRADESFREGLGPVPRSWPIQTFSGSLFTGSIEAGSLVQEVAGGSKSFKVLTLELGGKNPILVFPEHRSD